MTRNGELYWLPRSFWMAFLKVAVIVTVGVSITLVLIHETFGMDRGLDFTDESFYIIASGGSNSESTWRFPFEWHTGPLYRSLGEDISVFRTGGAFLIAALGASLGAVIAFLFHVEGRKSETRSSRVFGFISGVSIGVLGSLLFYTGFLRTPGYNWVNFLGILNWGLGLLTWKVLVNNPQARLVSELALILTSFGLFFSSTGRPSTPVLLLAISGFFFVTNLSARLATLATVRLVVYTTLWIVLAVSSGLWPLNFYEYFIEGFAKPSLNQIKLDAILLDLISSIGYLWNHLALLIVGIGIAGMLLFATTPRIVISLPSIFYFVAPVLSLSLILDTTYSPFSSTNQYVWARAEYTSVGIASILAGGTLIAFEKLNQPDRPQRERSALLQSTLLVLLPMPFVFGFASGNGGYAMASFAIVALLLGAFALSFLIFSSYQRHLFQAGILALSGALLAVTVVDGWQNPYRTSPLETATSRVEFGPNQRPLLLDSEAAKQIHELRMFADSNSLMGDSEVLVLTWTWQSAIPLVLGTSPPSTVMTTIGGYEASTQVGIHNLNRSFELKSERPQFVITQQIDTLEKSSAEDYLGFIETVAVSARIEFGVAYKCLGSRSGIQIWELVKQRSDHQTSAAAMMSSFRSCGDLAEGSSNPLIRY